MKTRRWLVAASLVTSLSMGVPSAVSQEVSVGEDSKGRQLFRDERPDESIGWMTVSKASYWPLAYEALDRIEETKELIGQSKPEELADSLEKVSAWLRLAASAAMTDGRAGIGWASDLCADAADSLRSGSTDWNEEKLTQLLTAAHLAMAKSHFLRAGSADESPQIQRVGRTAQKTKLVLEASKEIAAANREAAVARYRFDNREAARHLKVGRVYYQAACALGGLNDQLAESFTAIADPPTEGKLEDVVYYYDEEVRPRVKQALEVVAGERKKLVAVLDE